MQLQDVPHMGLDAAIGFRIDSITPQRVTGSLPATTDVLGPDGSVHRGVLSSAIESAASVAAAAHVGDAGQVVGVANSTSYFATVTSGTITEPVSVDGERQEWLVRVTDDAGRLMAQGTFSSSPSGMLARSQPRASPEPAPPSRSGSTCARFQGRPAAGPLVTIGGGHSGEERAAGTTPAPSCAGPFPTALAHAGRWCDSGARSKNSASDESDRRGCTTSAARSAAAGGVDERSRRCPSRRRTPEDGIRRVPPAGPTVGRGRAAGVGQRRRPRVRGARDG